MYIYLYGSDTPTHIYMDEHRERERKIQLAFLTGVTCCYRSLQHPVIMIATTSLCVGLHIDVYLDREKVRFSRPGLCISIQVYMHGLCRDSQAVVLVVMQIFRCQSPRSSSRRRGKVLFLPLPPERVSSSLSLHFFISTVPIYPLYPQTPRMLNRFTCFLSTCLCIYLSSCNPLESLTPVKCHRVSLHIVFVGRRDKILPKSLFRKTLSSFITLGLLSLFLLFFLFILSLSLCQLMRSSRALACV